MRPGSQNKCKMLGYSEIITSFSSMGLK